MEMFKKNVKKNQYTFTYKNSRLEKTSSCFHWILALHLISISLRLGLLSPIILCLFIHSVKILTEHFDYARLLSQDEKIHQCLR